MPQKLRMNTAIATAVGDEMRSDPSVIMLGEDVAAAGGPFKTSEGLVAEFGPQRVRDTPISEMAFTGAAVGAASMGMRPVIEIMFIEFLGVALDQLSTQAAKFRYLSNGALSVPMVLRASVGTGTGFGSQHSQTLENWLSATPGLVVASPSDPQTAYGLTRAAIRHPDPVVLLEPRVLYGARAEVTTGDAGIVPLGRARVLRPGGAATLVTLGRTTSVALTAASELSTRGHEVEVIDLLTLVPWDIETVLASVRRTGRLVVVEDSPLSGGWGSEVIAAAVRIAFGDLKAAPFRITAPDVPVPYGKDLEARYAPQAEEIVRQIDVHLRTGEVPDPWWALEEVAS
ncbi:alpha-ketoacid dehydrogenase subunit beta [Kribbella sp. NPDC050124]|uniref:alpha-ketoacid dehydrogenase subunit beta n=1 Tax=Kribbella sp. NPDC050124 TaxID=3364114 RepID=UPI0037B7F3F7